MTRVGTTEGGTPAGTAPLWLPRLYLGLNVGCTLVVAAAAHRVSAVMAAEGRTPSDSVDGITFFTHALPGVAGALVLNVTWAVWALVNAVRGRRGALGWLGAAAAVWAATVLGGNLGLY